MSFIPSFLKSAPQAINVTIIGDNFTGDQAITSVDLLNSILLFNGMFGDSSAGSAQGEDCAYGKFTSATNVRATRSMAGFFHQQCVIGCTVIEFNRAFLRQNIYFNDTHATNFAHGLTLGPKAFAVCSGWAALAGPGSGSNTSQVQKRIKLNGANIEIDGSGYLAGVFIIDPR